MHKIPIIALLPTYLEAVNDFHQTKNREKRQRGEKSNAMLVVASSSIASPFSGSICIATPSRQNITSPVSTAITEYISYWQPADLFKFWERAS